MTLHIALDGINGLGKTTQVKKLQRFLIQKSYRVKAITLPQNEIITHILNDYSLTLFEKAMLTAIDKSLIYNWEDLQDYDIVIWDGSILNSLAYHTNSEVKESFIKNINRFFPEMDLIIVITHYQYVQEQDFKNRVQYDLIQKFDKLIAEHNNVSSIDFIQDNPDKMHNEIVKVVFQELPTCRWCGRLFTKSSTNKKYCCQTCKDYAKEEQNRDNFRNYYNRYKDTMSESKRGALGSKGANLHGRANSDHNVELQLINNEKRRLGL